MVPIETELSTTNTIPFLTKGEILFVTSSRFETSMAFSSSSGVGTQMKITSVPSRASLTSIVAFSFFVLTASFRRSGYSNLTVAELILSTLSFLTSNPITSNPVFARKVAKGKPTVPTPTTHIFRFFFLI